MKKKETVPIPQKLLLTVEEAAEYSGISERVWRDRLSEGEYNFVLKNGTKTLIKRRLFEKYLESVDAI
ncbi:MAG: excisionase family DNA-binding protein [Eubacterium sp.]|nr:excisionase family DNA-binding protein [Eubacterium sp.]